VTTVPAGIPTGKIKTNERSFERVIREVRHAVFAIVRIRPVNVQTNQYQLSPIGSGFFVGPDTFLTCWHVLREHQEGDSYHLLANVKQAGLPLYQMHKVQLGKELHFFPSKDLAIFKTSGRPEQPFLAVDYGEVQEGKEIGVLGYPLAMLAQAPNGQIQADGLRLRVAKDVVTASYQTNLRFADGTVIGILPVIEVNFLFVHGNSGGPIIQAGTGRALGFVHGFQAIKIQEEIEKITHVKAEDIPAGMGNQYFSKLSAIYSIGISLGAVRSELEQFGVTL
jgi:hypothetical protein